MKLVLFHVLGWVRGLSEGPRRGFPRRCSPAVLGVKQQPDSAVPRGSVVPQQPPISTFLEAPGM